MLLSIKKLYYSYLFSFIFDIENLLSILKIISDLILIISNTNNYSNIFYKKLFISKSEKFYLFF